MKRGFVVKKEGEGREKEKEEERRGRRIKSTIAKREKLSRKFMEDIISRALSRHNWIA